MKFLSIVFLSLFSIGLSKSTEPTNADSAEWKLAKNKNGVVVYTRKTEGAKIREFQAIVKIKTNMTDLQKQIENAESYTEWQPHITNSKTLKKLNDNERYIYYALDVPWPLQDRDVVVFSKKTKTKSGDVLYRLKSKPDFIENKEKYIRIRDAYGFWKLSKQSGGLIKVVYQSYGDPAGSIPTGIINMFIVDGPYKTMLNLKNKLEGNS